MPGEPFAMPPVQPSAVGADHDVGAPGFQPQGQPHHMVTAPVGGETLIALLPAVAVRAVKNRSAVACVEAGDGRQIVDDAGRDQQVPGVFLGAVAERHAVVIAGEPRAGDADVP